MNFESARVSYQGSKKQIGKFTSAFTQDEQAEVVAPKPAHKKNKSWADKNISVMCRNFTKKRTRFAVISLESDVSAEYDEIHAVSSEGTLRE